MIIYIDLSFDELKQHIDDRLDSISRLDNFKGIARNDLIPKNQKILVLNVIIEQYSKLHYKEIKTKYNINIDSLNSETALSELYKKKLNILLTKDEFSRNKSLVNLEMGDDAKITLDKNDFFKKLNSFSNINSDNVSEVLDSLGYEKTRYNRFLFLKTKEAEDTFSNKKKAKVYGRKFLSKSSLVMLFLLPFFGLLVWLLYVRHNYSYTDHLIFVFHTQTVLFILLFFFMLLDRLLSTDIFTILLFPLFGFYLYKAIRNFYGQKRLNTILKQVILSIGYTLLTVIGGVIAAFLAFLI